MGCSSSNIDKDGNPYEDNKNSFEKLEKIIKSYKEAIAKYKIYKEDYEEIFEQQMKCEKLLKNYFSLQKSISINLSNEPNEIKNYKKTFNRVNKLEDNLKVIPGFLNKYKYNIKTKKEAENNNEENNSDKNSEDDDNKKYVKKEKKKKKK